jgi:hypothetical protein
MRQDIKRKSILTLILISVLLMNTGCGALYGSIVRGAALEGRYDEIKDTMPAIPEEQGRVVVYMTAGGPRFWNMIGIITKIKVDHTTFPEMLGASYTYLDLEKGAHNITTGKNTLDFELNDKDIKYVRIDAKDYIFIRVLNKYNPILIESDIAETEIAKLKYNKDFERYLK